MTLRTSSIQTILAACAVWALALSGCSSAPTEATETSSSELGAPVCSSVAQNQTASITCPAGQVVTAISFASFGTPTGTCGSFKTGSCNATTSVPVVSAACLGKASCSVAATTAVFGNPCSGTSKTLDIQVSCGSGSDAGATDAGHDASDSGASDAARDASDAGATDASHDASDTGASDAGHDASDASGPPPNVICGSAPQNGTVSLSCPAGQAMQSIQFASFGTPTGTCGSFKTGSCNATNSVSIVSTACVGKASCSVAATTAVFGNPCSGTSKTLDIQALCQGSSGCTIGGTVYAAGATANNGCEVCNPAVSTTAWTLVTNGTACSDSNACTRTDSCLSGACVGANPVVCTASDACHGVGTCNPANGVCSNPAQPNGTGCSDGNACTQTDTCQAGACVGGNPVSCAVADECHLAGSCNPATGTCPARPDGSVCTGALRCTSYACVTGNCTASATQLCTIVDHSGPTYDNDCQQLGVPVPPPWGSNSIGAPGAGKPWTDNGSFGPDSYVDLDTAEIYYSTPPTVNGPGVCVINSHQFGSSEFDVICQGPTGKACFWAGANGTPAQVPGGNGFSVLDNDFTGSGLIVSHSNDINDITTGCTSCHAGENAFITHMNPTTHPLSLNHPAILNGAALPGWMPSSWFDPVMGSNARHNPGPNPYVGYYPSSTSGCLGCHTQTNAGRFPVVANDPRAGVGSFCDVLAEVTNRPAFDDPGGLYHGGGMPPYATNACIPSSTRSTDNPCAIYTDPFVEAMIETCNGLAVSFANSPVAVDANVPSNPGSFDYLVTDTETTVGSPTFEVMENLYNNGSFRGWELSPSGFFGFSSRFRGAMWVKNLGTTTDVAYATNDSTDYLSGDIWERTLFGDVRNVTQFASGSGNFAAGSPSAYVRHDGVNSIVFRATSQYLYESTWNPASATWFTSQMADTFDTVLTATGDPIGYNRGSSSSVVYKCAEQAMCELRLFSGNWSFRQFPTAAKILQYVPMPIGGAYNGQHTIFYSARDGVHALEDACEPAFCATPPSDTLLFGDTSVMSAPIPYNDQNGGTSVVYIADGGGGSPSFVVQLSNDGGAGWKARTLAQADKATETFVGDPAAYLAIGPHLNTILFRNSAGTLYQLQWNASSASYVKSTVSF